MSYHIESNYSFEELPERILVRETGWLGALRFHDEPVVDYWYVPERTCKAIKDTDYFRGIHGYCQCLKCSECNEPLFSEFRYCPWCGRRVVS